jgi:uncharacterized repeat protein (TIGR01451 family)
VTYSFAVTNNGNVTLHDITVNDPMLGGQVCTIDSLAVDETSDPSACQAQYTVTQAMIDANAPIENTAVAKGQRPDPDNPPPDAPDTDVVTPELHPSMTLSKTSDYDGVPITEAGTVVTYSFAVTNNGNVTLHDITVNDPMLGGQVCTIDSLAVGQTSEPSLCQGTYTVTQDDINANKSIPNTAVAKGLSPDPDNPPPDAPDTDVVTPVQNPALYLDKSADPMAVSEIGQVITYTFSVENTGNVPLTDVVVTDPMFGGQVCTIPTLAIGETNASCTATHVVTADDIAAGTIHNVAVATGEGPDPANPPDPSTDTVTVPTTQTAALGLVKTADPMTYDAVGQTITYSFAVTNEGNVPLTNVQVFDPMFNGTAPLCTIAVLAAGDTDTSSCTATYDVTQADLDNGSITNLARAHGTPPEGVDPPNEPTSTVTVDAVQTPRMTLTKTSDWDNKPITDAGTVVTYSFVVTNTGNVTLNGITVNDPMLGGYVCTIDTLEVGASSDPSLCQGTYTVTQADIDAGQPIENIAVASGSGDNPPPDTPGTDIVTPEQHPDMTLSKTSNYDNETITDAGTVVTYSFAVTNTGNVTLSDIVVNDPMLGGYVCTIDSLAVGATSDPSLCQSTYTVTQADIDANQPIHNVAVASGHSPDKDNPPPDAPGEDIVTPEQHPDMTLSKTSNYDDTAITTGGTVVTYTFVVTNTGNVALHDIVLNYPLLSDSPICTIPTLAIGASSDPSACQGTYTVSQAQVDAGQPIHNVAVAKGQGPDSDNPPPDAPGEDVVTPVANPSFDVVKYADPETVSQVGDVIDYWFIVTNTGNVPLTDIVVDDPMLGGVVCTIDALPVGATTDKADCEQTYTVTAEDLTQPTIHNVATVTGKGPGDDNPPPKQPDNDVNVAAISIDKAATLNGAVVDEVANGDSLVYTYTVTNIGNVPLTDVTVAEISFSGTGEPPTVVTPCTIVSGTVTVTDGAMTMQPGAVVECTSTAYEVTVEDAANAGFLDNTAAATGTDPDGDGVSATDTAHVTVNEGATPTIPAGPTETVTVTPTAPTETVTVTPTAPTTTVTTTQSPTGPAPSISAGPKAPTGGSVATGGYAVLPWTAACFGLIALLFVGLRRRNEEHAS